MRKICFLVQSLSLGEAEEEHPKPDLEVSVLYRYIRSIYLVRKEREEVILMVMYILYVPSLLVIEGVPTVTTRQWC